MGAEFDSVCRECRYCGKEARTKDTPELFWCELMMENFGLAEGCCNFKKKHIFGKRKDGCPLIEITEPLKFGWWIPNEKTADVICSNCGVPEWDISDYCPNCGAKMERAKHERTPV